MTESTSSPRKAESGADAGEVAVLLDGAYKTYGEGRSSVEAVKPTDLEIPRGELVVVLGPSGSGKTTLLNIIGAIEPPTGGRIVVDDRDISDLGDRERTRFRREEMGFVFQFFNLIPTLTALENVQLIAELADRGGEDASREALESVGLVDRMDHFPGALSGGEQQRVAIARALAKKPPLLLCDEPTGSLDLDTGRQILGLLQELNRQERRTMLLVTHNEAIARIATRVLRMGSGEIVADERNETPSSADEVTW